MRKYQRKLVTDLNQLYNSNDPLRYLFMASKLGVNNYQPSKRELRLFTRRVGKMVEGTVAAVKRVIPAIIKGINDMAKAAGDAARSMKELSEAASDRD